MVLESAVDLVDLLDLKMPPAWVNEPAEAGRYSHIEGEERTRRDERPPHERRSKGKRPTSKGEKGKRAGERLHGKKRDRYLHRGQDRQVSAPIAPPPIIVRFLPHPLALENVVAQIKENSVAYSLFALARLFLEKPARYDVRLTAPAELPLLQVGEDGAVSVDRQFLERNAFRLAQSDFYKIDITQSEPIKGNFSNVARCKLSGTLLGPTNHHDYQKRLRSLYEQRFSRRMNFADYQRQIEILTDPQLVERWKEDARKLTTFTTLREDTPATFASAGEAERHFRESYLPGLIRSTQELTIDGVASRSLSDRVLHRLIEGEWASATRSPSGMMQELGAQFRQAGLYVFRHRRGMLFVSPIRVRAFIAGTAMSPSIKAIMESVSSAPGIGRKELADKLIVDLAGEEAERAKLALAADLRWLVSEGYVVEFNDGSLDLPRGKAKAVVEAAVPAANEPPEQAEIAQPAMSLVDAEIGGS